MANKDKKIGKQTVKLENPPKIISTYSIVGPKEGDGPLRKYFHKIISDDTLGKDSFEKAESEMMYTAIREAIKGANLTEDKIDVTLLFVEDNDGNTHIYAEDNTKTIEDYIKLYEDMHLNSQVYDDFNVAYLISEASS